MDAAAPPPPSPSEIYSSKNVPSRLRLGKDIALPDVGELSAVEQTSALSPTSAGSPEVSWMDEKRRNMSAYEYLCRLEEAKQWLQDCLGESLPEVAELGEHLQNGVVLARVTKKFAPDLVKKIFESPKLQFRHSDNINYFFQFIQRMGLPEVCMFELTDLYDMKNIPKVVYSIHALGHVMQKRHIGPTLKNLVGKIEFTDEEVDAMQANLDEAGVKLPVFSEVSQVVEKEAVHVVLPEDKAAEDSGAEFNSPTSVHATEVPLPPSPAVDPAEVRAAYFRAREAQIVCCQKQARMQVARRKYLARRAALRAQVAQIVRIQAWVRGCLFRKRRAARHRFFEQNASAIVAIQAWMRTKVQASAYQALMSRQPCPVHVVAKFLHLLGADDRDAATELDVEQAKEVVVKQIRENARLETELADLDIKIALLVKNRITLDELVKVANKKRGKSEKKGPGEAQSDSDLARLSASLFQLDRASRDRLENYQQMFYLLQTQPKYLTKLLWTMSDSAHDSAKKHLETCILTIFSYAQNAREEYLLLKLMESIVASEIEHTTSLKDFVNSDPSFFNLVVHYVRGAKERQYLQSTLKAATLRILECGEELDTNPLVVYKSLIKEEESTTGNKSTKKFEVTLEEALNDSNTLARVKHNRVLLQGYVRLVLGDILKSIGQMPYGIRYISKLLLEALTKKFPSEPQESLLKIVGNLIYYRYMNPALVSPDAFNVTSNTVTPLARKNLTEVGKLLNIICCGKEQQQQQQQHGQMMELDAEYRRAATTMFFDFLLHVVKVPGPEVQLNYDEYADVARTRHPVIYISMNEVFLMHETLLKYKDTVCSGSGEDPLSKLLETMGAPPVLAQDNNGPEIALTLAPLRVTADLQEDHEMRRLFYRTKKDVTRLIRVCPNHRDLCELLDSATSEHDEAAYAAHVHGGAPLQLYTSHQTLALPAAAGAAEKTLHELKADVKAAMERLETAGLVHVKDGYQALLDSIVTDIRTKHVRREQLRNEKLNLASTLNTLQEKHAFLKDKEKSYLEYVDACTQQLTSHSGQQLKKKRSFFALGKQARHIRDVEKKTGAVPKFGSYIYTAKELLEKGIISWVDPERVPGAFLDKLHITLSSDTPGVFEVEASLGVGTGVKAIDNKLSMKENDSFKLEELLSLQFENKPEIPLFDNSVRANVNLMIYFINKRFYAS